MSQRKATAAASASSKKGATTTVVEDVSSASPAVASSSSAAAGAAGAAAADRGAEEKAPFLVAKGGPVRKGALSLEATSAAASAGGGESSGDEGGGGVGGAEERYQVERHDHRTKHWRESPFAVGLVEPTWADERLRGFGPKRSHGDDELNPDETGCLWCSAFVCPLLGAGRVGNMAVLRSSQEWVEEIEEDVETGQHTTRRYTRPRLDVVVGPYWPMMAFCTYPLILGVSGWAFFAKILPGRNHPLVIVVWLALTLALIVALAFTACRDPGILYKYERPPPQDEVLWRWSDRAHSYRPRSSFYDADTAMVVEDFDHTCPWTGTAIGKKNMLAFQLFVCLVFVCMIMNILTLAGVFDIIHHH